jgi:hypothetical protein
VYTKFWYGKPKGKSHYEDLDVDGRILEEWILYKWDGRVWSGFVWLRIETSGGFL